MKYAAGLLLALPFLFFSSPACAATSTVSVHTEGDSNVSVHSDVKSSSTNKTVVTQNGSTSVHIEQTGNGTSKVDVNGRQWELNGPGKIDEETGTPNPSSDNTPTITIPAVSITPFPNHTATISPILTVQEKPRTSFIQQAIATFLKRLFTFLGI
ncbi:MAG: hypothetical protein ACM3IJ_03115 [Candidatus Levyibacteriota bacterium]